MVGETVTSLPLDDDWIFVLLAHHQVIHLLAIFRVHPVVVRCADEVSELILR
jgi:hypothetical protein